MINLVTWNDVLERINHDGRKISQKYRRLLCACQSFAGILSFVVLAVIYGIRRFKPFAVGLYELVPDDNDTEEARCEKRIVNKK